jgi:hypothetical protein
MPKPILSHRPRLPKLKLPKGINVNLPGYTPNWQNLIETDPTYMQFVGGQQAASARERARRNENVLARLIGFGALPEGVNLSEFGGDDATRQAILAYTQSGLSETAQLARGHDTNVQALQDMLAARGMLRSGSLGVGLGQEQTRYAGEQVTRREALLKALRDLQDVFAGAESTREQDRIGQAETTAGRLRESGLYEPREARSVKARRDPVTGLYVDADGNTYDRSGNPTSRLAGRRPRIPVPPRIPPPPRRYGRQP